MVMDLRPPLIYRTILPIRFLVCVLPLALVLGIYSALAIALPAFSQNLPAPPAAKTVRIATYHVDLTRVGPGILLRDIRQNHPQIEALGNVIRHIDPDVLLLSGIEYDYRQRVLTHLANFIGGYPYMFTLRPPSGYPSGYDLDGNGRITDNQDMLSYGRFPGHRGMAILSKLPIDGNWNDYTFLRSKDLPAQVRKLAGRIKPLAFLQGAEREGVDNLPFSFSGHWQVPIILPDKRTIRLLAFSASPPIRNSQHTLNLYRNRIESAFWLDFIDRATENTPNSAPLFILLGNANSAPDSTNGAGDIIRRLLLHPYLQDPHPNIATVYWGEGSPLPPMRVDYLLPARKLKIQSSGVFNAAKAAPLDAFIQRASRHRLVWVDILLEP